MWLDTCSQRLTMRWLTAVALGVAVGGGCVIPPPLKGAEDVDAAANAIPVITEIDSSFPSPGPIVIRRQESDTMSLTVRDNDLDDTIWIFLFVDYGYPNPVPHLNDCQSSVRALDRTLVCPLNALCAFEEGPPDTLHFLEAMVTDRDLLDDGGADFRAVPEDTGVSYRSWLMTCSE